MDLFFAAIAGALVSLLGVLLTLRRNQKVHEENLKEERRKIREEREFLAKQAALLSASEAVTRFINYYISLADKVLPSDGTVAEEVNEMAIALNRLHFFCSLETIEKSTHLIQILNGVVTEAIKAKIPSAFIIEELKVIDLQISALEKMNSRIQEEIKAILQSNPQSPLIVSHREKLAENFQATADLCEKRVELIKQKYIETEKCRDVIVRNLRTIYQSLIDALLLARQELSFSIDQKRYKEIMDEQLESMLRNVEDLFAEIRKQVTDKMKSE